MLVACRDRARLMGRAMSRSRRRHWPTLRRGRRGSGGIAQSQMCPSTMRLCMPPPRASTSFHVHKLSCKFPALCFVLDMMHWHPVIQDLDSLSDTRGGCPLAEAAAWVACVNTLMTAAVLTAWSALT